MTNFMLLFLDRSCWRIDRLLIVMSLVMIKSLGDATIAPNNAEILQTTNYPLSANKQIINWQQQQQQQQQRSQQNYHQRTSGFNVDPSTRTSFFSSNEISMTPATYSFKSNHQKSTVKLKFGRKSMQDDLLYKQPPTKPSNHQDFSKRQLKSSEDFSNSDNLDNNGLSLAGDDYENKDLEPVEMHTNNHQSSAANINNQLSSTTSNEQSSPVNSNSRHYNQNYNNNNQPFSNSLYGPSTYHQKKLYGVNYYSGTGQQQQQSAYSGHQLPSLYSSMGKHQQLGSIPAKNFASQSSLSTNSIPLISSYTANNLNYIQNMLINSNKVPSSSVASSAAASSSIGAGGSNSASSSSSSIASLYSAMGSLLSPMNLQQTQQSPPQIVMQSSSSSSGATSPMNQGQVLKQLTNSNNNQPYLVSNSLDSWDGSGNYLHSNNNNNQQQQPTTSEPINSNNNNNNNNIFSFSRLANNYVINTNGSAYSIDGISNCGRQQVGHREPRIVGGNSTYEGEFPWAVSIQRHGNHHCGGVIVGRRWILTAAHCVRSQLVGNLLVRTGGHTLSRSANSINSHLERDYFVESIIMHGDFSKYDNLTASQLKSSANTNNADIALLRLRNDIQWNELAWPVCFAHRDIGNFSGHDAVVIGWGKLSEKSEDFSNDLQKVKLNIIDNKLCQNWFRQAGRDMPIDERIICAGFKTGGKDACHGDSGGPLLTKVNGQFVVVGVVSTGIGCARPLLPGLYSRVSSYIDWIESHVHPPI